MKTEKSAEANAKKWMLVDDEEGTLSVMRQIVSRLGITRVEAFTSSMEALAAFEAAPESYELVITDFQMPHLDGIELSRRMLMAAPKIKILLMTGSGLIDDKTAVQNGLCGLLRKPFKIPALQQVFTAIADGTFSSDSPKKDF
jgi:CheY-like chemotaxis protein